MLLSCAVFCAALHLQELWHEIDSKASFDKALQDLPANKLLLIDYYAPTCAVCKTAYSTICRVADTQQYKQSYVFCKASLMEAEVKTWIKAEGVTGIPHVGVYSKDGTKLLGMGGSIKKIDALKSNLDAITKNMESVVGEGHLLQLDPNGFVVLPASAAVAQ
jgi:thiol:disulfide interchange protein